MADEEAGGGQSGGEVVVTFGANTTTIDAAFNKLDERIKKYQDKSFSITPVLKDIPDSRLDAILKNASNYIDQKINSFAAKSFKIELKVDTQSLTQIRQQVQSVLGAPIQVRVQPNGAVQHVLPLSNNTTSQGNLPGITDTTIARQTPYPTYIPRGFNPAYAIQNSQGQQYSMPQYAGQGAPRWTPSGGWNTNYRRPPAGPGLTDINANNPEHWDQFRQGASSRLDWGQGSINAALNNLRTNVSMGVLPMLRNFHANYRDQWQQEIRRLEGEGRRHFFAGATLSYAVTAPALLAGRAAINEASGFQSKMQKVAALTPNDEGSLPGLSKSILDMSKDLPQTAHELADGLYQVSSAGFAGKEAIDVLKASATGAAGGLGETGTVADTVTTVLNAYGKAAYTATDATDILTRAVIFGKGEADQYAPALGRVVAAAKVVGISFEEVSANIAVMSRIGIKPGEGAAALNALLRNVQAPSTEARKALAAMGKGPDFLLSGLQNKGLFGTLQEIFKITGGNIQIIDALVGSIRGLRDILSTVGAQEGAYKQALEEMNNAHGDSARAMDVMSRTFDFQWKVMVNAVRRPVLEIGTQLLPMLTGKVNDAARNIPDAITRITTAWATLNPSVQKGIGVGAAGLLLAGPMFQILSLTSTIRAAFLAMGTGVFASLPIAILAIGAAAITATRGMSGLNEVVDSMIDHLNPLDRSLGGIATKIGALIILLPQLTRLIGAAGAIMGAPAAASRLWAGLAGTGGALAGVATAFRGEGGFLRSAWNAANAPIGRGAAATLSTAGDGFVVAGGGGGAAAAVSGAESTLLSVGGTFALKMAGIAGLLYSIEQLLESVVKGWFNYQAAVQDAELNEHNRGISHQKARESLQDVREYTSGDPKFSSRIGKYLGRLEKADSPGNLDKIINDLVKERDQIIRLKIDEGSKKLALMSIQELIDAIKSESINLKVKLKIIRPNDPAYEDDGFKPPTTKPKAMTEKNWHNMKRVFSGTFMNGPTSQAEIDSMKPYDPNGLPMVFKDSLEEENRKLESQKSFEAGKYGGEYNNNNALIAKMLGSNPQWWARQDLTSMLHGIGRMTDKKRVDSAYSELSDKFDDSIDTQSGDGRLGRQFRPYLSALRRRKTHLDTLEAERNAQKIKKASGELGGGHVRDIENAQEEISQRRELIAAHKSYEGVLDSTIAKVREYAERTEEARARTEMYKHQLDAVDKSYKEQAISIARVLDRMKEMSEFRKVERSFFGPMMQDARSRGISTASLQQSAAEMAKRDNYQAHMQTWQRTGLALGDAAKAGVKSEIQTLEDAIRELTGQIKAWQSDKRGFGEQTGNPPKGHTVAGSTLKGKPMPGYKGKPGSAKASEAIVDVGETAQSLGDAAVALFNSADDRIITHDYNTYGKYTGTDKVSPADPMHAWRQRAQDLVSDVKIIEALEKKYRVGEAGISKDEKAKRMDMVGRRMAQFIEIANDYDFSTLGPDIEKYKRDNEYEKNSIIDAADPFKMRAHQLRRDHPYADSANISRMLDDPESDKSLKDLFITKLSEPSKDEAHAANVASFGESLGYQKYLTERGPTGQYPGRRWYASELEDYQAEATEELRLRGSETYKIRGDKELDVLKAKDPEQYENEIARRMGTFRTNRYAKRFSGSSHMSAAILSNQESKDRIDDYKSRLTIASKGGFSDDIDREADAEKAKRDWITKYTEGIDQRELATGTAKATLEADIAAGAKQAYDDSLSESEAMAKPRAVTEATSALRDMHHQMLALGDSAGVTAKALDILDVSAAKFRNSGQTDSMLSGNLEGSFANIQSDLKNRLLMASAHSELDKLRVGQGRQLSSYSDAMYEMVGKTKDNEGGVWSKADAESSVRAMKVQQELQLENTRNAILKEYMEERSELNKDNLRDMALEYDLIGTINNAERERVRTLAELNKWQEKNGITLDPSFVQQQAKAAQDNGKVMDRLAFAGKMSSVSGTAMENYLNGNGTSHASERMQEQLRYEQQILDLKDKGISKNDELFRDAKARHDELMRNLKDKSGLNGFFEELFTGWGTALRKMSAEALNANLFEKPMKRIAAGGWRAAFGKSKGKEKGDKDAPAAPADDGLGIWDDMFGFDGGVGFASTKGSDGDVMATVQNALMGPIYVTNMRVQSQYTTVTGGGDMNLDGSSAVDDGLGAFDNMDGEDSNKGKGHSATQGILGFAREAFSVYQQFG